jgi:hypothetical protein
MLGRTIGSVLATAVFTLCSLPIVAYALVDKPSEGAPQAAQTSASVIVFNQKLKGDQITVTYAFMPAAGQLVIHGSGKDGKADKVVFGSLALEAGDHRDIGVKLDKTPSPGTALWATLTTAEKTSFWPAGLPLQNEFRVE